MNTLTEKQTIILDAMKTARTPAGVTTIMRWCKKMDSKAQIKIVLEQLIRLGEIKLQSNGQYALINKTTGKAKPRKPAVLSAKAETETPAAKADETIAELKVISELSASQRRVDELSGQLNRANKQIDELKEQHTAEQVDAAHYLNSLNKILDAAGCQTMSIDEFIRNIKQEKTAGDQLKEQLKYQTELARKCLVELNALQKKEQAAAAEIKTLTNWVANIEAENEKLKAANAELQATASSQAISPRQAMDALVQMISGIFNDQTSVIVYAAEMPEIICDGIRYEIPVGTDKEITSFIESLSWVDGQRIIAA